CTTSFYYDYDGAMDYW
nr:immunoglobulin heavy chain junction region [Mus musculus]